MPYNELKLELIQDTLAKLQARISERFPGSGLSNVAAELVRIGEETGPVLERVRQPNWWLRAGIAVAVLLLVGVVAWAVYTVSALSLSFEGLGALLEGVEAAVQEVVFLAIAIWFLATLETRLHRRISLRALHRLRTIVHIVDMHQLTKDPEHLLSRGERTPSSPERSFTPFLLSRYLDYCTELLSLASKLAALHVQYVNDPVVLNAVNDIEVLASNLSAKIGQKIIVLDTVEFEGARGVTGSG